MMTNMTRKDIFIFGAGGHARVALDIIELSDCYKFAGYVMPSGTAGADVIEEERFLNDKAFAGKDVFIGIGENVLRRKIARRLEQKFQYPNLIHPSAILSRSAVLGHGNIVMANAVINPGAKVGNFGVFNTASILEHDCNAEDFVSLAPGAVVCGDCQLGSGAYVGANAVVVHGLSIGAWSVIGAGASVVRNVSALTVNIGAPARTTRSKSEEDFVL